MNKDLALNALNELKNLNPWKYVKSDNLISVKCLNFSGYVNMYGDDEYKVIIIYPGENGYNEFCYDTTRLPVKGSEVEEKLTTFYLIAYFNDEIMISYNEMGFQETVELEEDQYTKIATFTDTMIKGFKKYIQTPLKLVAKTRDLEIIKKSNGDVTITTYEYEGLSIYKDYGFSEDDKDIPAKLYKDKHYEISIAAVDFALEINGVNRPVFVSIVRDIETNDILLATGAYYDENHDAIKLLEENLKDYALEHGFAQTVDLSDKPSVLIIHHLFEGKIDTNKVDMSQDMIKDILTINQKIRYKLPEFKDNVAKLDTLIWPFKTKRV